MALDHMKNTTKKLLIILICLVILFVFASYWYDARVKRICDEAMLSFPKESQEQFYRNCVAEGGVSPENKNSPYQTIFKTHLDNIDNSKSGNNFFIGVNNFNKVKITILKNGSENEITDDDIQEIILHNDYKPALIPIQKVNLTKNTDIGLVHNSLNKEYYRNSSGYIIPEQTANDNENICLNTSIPYNNWVCFIYKDGLIMSYAQNFAD